MERAWGKEEVEPPFRLLASGDWGREQLSAEQILTLIPLPMSFLFIPWIWEAQWYMALGADAWASPVAVCEPGKGRISGDCLWRILAAKVLHLSQGVFPICCDLFQVLLDPADSCLPSLNQDQSHQSLTWLPVISAGQDLSVGARGLAHHEFQMGTWPITLQSYSSLGLSHVTQEYTQCWPQGSLLRCTLPGMLWTCRLPSAKAARGDCRHAATSTENQGVLQAWKRSRASRS